MRNRYDDFLRRMNQYRQSRRLTQAKAGELIGKTQSQFSKMELGKTVISYHALSELLHAGWDIDYIIIGKETASVESRLTDSLCERLGGSWKALAEVVIFAIGRGLTVEKLFSDREAACEFELLKLALHQEKRDTLLSDIRKIMNMTQLIMAEKMGVNIKKYRDLERGNAEPDAELLSIIYDISYCRPNVFFHMDDMESYLLDDLWNRLSAASRDAVRSFLNNAIDFWLS